MQLKPFAFIIINTLYILIHFMIICFIIKMQIANAYPKCRMYIASLQRARGVPTTRPWRSRRPHSVATACCLTRCGNPMHAQNKRRCMAFYAIAQRFHSVCTALLAFAQRTPRRSAFLNAVGTPLWCDRGFTSHCDIYHIFKSEFKLSRLLL